MSGTVHQLHERSPDSLEERRQAALERYAVLDTPRDGAFDAITALAARLFDVPIAIISLVDRDRIWLRSRHGLEGVDLEQVERTPGLCASAMIDGEPWVVRDAALDPRTIANPLVAGEFGLRFYAGVPLTTWDGHNLGTLCIIDRKPRTMTDPQMDSLRDLASVVMDQMELRLSARRAVDDLSRTVAQKDAALADAALMAREIDHRVMNSLQLTSAMLSMQSRNIDDPSVADQLTIAASRIQSVARVHQHIYSTASVNEADLRSYLQNLCADLSHMLASEGDAGIIDVEAVEATVPTKRIVAIGLIVNELVTNAAKHGAGRIDLRLKRAPAGFALSVADHGPGLPGAYDPKRTHGLGMKVVLAQVRQIGGKLAFGPGDNGAGAKFVVTFPES
jgi:two-component sensor histidine kinase